MSEFAFAHPLIAGGTAGVLAPIIIHFFFRRRARQIEFSAMRFVLLSYKKVARRLLVQEYILLAVRCLIVLLLALALAVPSWTRIVQGLRRGNRPLAAMFIVDTSLSMSRPQKGQSLLDEARGIVADWVQRMAPGDRVGILDGARLSASGFLADPEKIKASLAALKISYAPARLPEAIAASASQFSELPELDKMIIVLSDLQRSSWTRPMEPRSDLPQIYVMDVAQKLRPRNLAVGGLNLKWKALAREESAAITAVVSNFGDAEVKQALLRIAFGAETAAQSFVDVAAGKSLERTFNLTNVPGGPGDVRLEVDDGMTGDNTAYFHLRGGQEVRALLVDGDPGTDYLQSETYFLGPALNPRLYARSRVNPRTATVAELPSLQLSDYAVLVLANVEKLPPEQVARIKDFVNTGGGLFLTLGDRVDADNYDAVWGDLLPRELRGVKLSYAGAQGSSDIRVMHLELPTADADPHPIVAVFADPSQGDLGLAGFWKYFLMQQEVVPKTRVILRLTDGTPMMVEGSYGKGRVIVFASTIDRTWNDLCIHPTYLPLMQQTVQYLGDAMVREDPGKLRAGAVVEIPVPSEVTGAKVRGPDGKIQTAELIEEAGARRVRFGQTDLPGVYAVKFVKPGQEAANDFTLAEAERSIVLNVDPAESDLTRLTESDIQAWTHASQVRVITPEAPIDPQAPPVKMKKSYEKYLLWLLVGLAIVERVLTRKG